MPIPNAIVRTVELAHPQERVWAALATLDGLSSWFSSHADGEIAPGQDVELRWEQYDDTRRTIGIEVVDPMSLFAYTWPVNGAPDDDPRRTYVEFALQPSGGGTRLTVTESGFAQLPDAWLDNSYKGNIEGWTSQLAGLGSYLDAAA